MAMTESELAAYSYTGAAGKRPRRLDDGCYYWFSPGYTRGGNEVPDNMVICRMVGGRKGTFGVVYRTEQEALAAADEAFRRAWREGWRPDGEVDPC